MERHPLDRFAALNPMDRRSFLRTGGAMVAGIPLASALLAACGGSTESGSGTDSLQLARPDNPVTLPLTDDNSPIDDGLQPEQGATLKLYNYDQYLWKKVADDFAKKYDCTIEISTFNTPDEAASKLRSGQVDYDVFFPSDDMIEKYAVSGLLRPLNHSYLPNLAKNVWPQFSAPDQPFYDVGQRYTVPYSVWTTGLAWRNDLVDPKDAPDAIDNPYDILWNPKYKGKISFYDDYRETITAALIRNGVTDVNTGDPAALQAAGDALIEAANEVAMALTVNGIYEDMPKGIFYAGLAWSGDVISSRWYGKGSAAETAATMSYWWPSDGKGVVGNDNLVVLKDGRNPVLAHMFLNYMLDLKVAMKNFSWVGYQPPQNDAPPEAFTDPKSPAFGLVPENQLNAVVRPEDFDTGYQELELSAEVDQSWHEQWERVTSR